MSAATSSLPVQLIVLALVVLVVVAVGVVVGMLVAPRLTAWVDRADEEERDD